MEYEDDNDLHSKCRSLRLHSPLVGLTADHSPMLQKKRFFILLLIHLHLIILFNLLIVNVYFIDISILLTFLFY